MRADAEPLTIRVDGQGRQVDPGSWPESINVMVRVGLGTGSKDKRIQARMAIYGPMTAAIAEGMAGPRHAFKWMDGLARDTGVGQGDDFMFNPEELAAKAEQEGPEPDPEMAKIEADMALQQAKLEGEQQLAVMRMDLQRQEAEAKQQLELERAEFEARLARDKAQFEADMAISKMRLEASLKREMAEATVSQNRAGGDLDK